MKAQNTQLMLEQRQAQLTNTSYLIYCSSLHALLEANVDWQDFFQSGADSHSTSVLGISTHELCKILSTGSSIIKLVSSQCLAQLFDRISEQKMHLNEELKCSPRYLQSIVAVVEGFVFHANGIVSRNCGSILAIMLGWENRVLRECSNKWCKLIVEELVVGLGTASGLSSKGFAYRLEGLVGIVVALLRWKTVPVWIGKLFRDTVVSGIVNQLTARNVTGEIVKLFQELMKRNYLTQEHVSILHHLFQVIFIFGILIFFSLHIWHAPYIFLFFGKKKYQLVVVPYDPYSYQNKETKEVMVLAKFMFQICRRQLYDENEANQLDEDNDTVTMGCDDSGKLWTQLIRLMLKQSKDCAGSRVKNKNLLDEIDLFFQESGKHN